MPLPRGGTASWPPGDAKPYIEQADRAAAWWTGDLEQLTATSGGQGETGRRRFYQRRRGTNAATGSNGDATRVTAPIHAPLAADIASVSSDLLFGDEITVSHKNPKVQEAIDELEYTLGLHNTFAEGAEMAAATGGCYLRVAWDETLAEHVLSRVHDQRQAVPDFRLGQLTAVTLWEILPGSNPGTDGVKGGIVWRHLERHERGVILHGLYQGTATELGRKLPLEAHPSTEPFKEHEEIRLPAELKGRLAVDYIPNLLPNRKGQRPIGRADVAGLDPMLDALDEVWTSLMRDVRLGQARTIVPDEWLKHTGGAPGGRAVPLDIDQEAFVGLTIPDRGAEGMMKPELVQPDIRVEQLLKGAEALVERIVSAAGYSPQTFGLHIEGTAQSGTALRIRQGKTDKTTGKKQRYWQPGLLSHIEKLLIIDGDVFGRRVPLDGERLTLDWPELAREPKEEAETIGILRGIRAMSVRSAVKRAQPHLGEKELDEEVELILGENRLAEPDLIG